MNLENARDLKASVLMGIRRAISKPATVRAMGIQTQTSDPKKGASRAFAVGITRKGKEHRLAIRIQRRMLESSSILDTIKKQAKGEIDVRYIGRVLKLETPRSLQRRRRPLVIGCSIGHQKVTAGTLGCFVKSRATHEHLILSNNHVLANENAAAIGDAILQPGKFDGGNVADSTVGALRGFKKLDPSSVNFVDCAVASIKETIEVRRRTLGAFGALAGLAPPIAAGGGRVCKVGRTTGETIGKITAFEVDSVVVRFGIGNLQFDNQIEIEGAGKAPFSASGDSGSLIFDGDRLAVSLLFAGSDQGGSNGLGVTYANPIQAVLDALKVDLLF